MLRLKLTNTPEWIELGHGVRVFVEPMSTAVMIAARRDPQIAALSDSTETLTNDDLALVMAKALARIAIKDWEGVGDAKGKPVSVTPFLRSGRSLRPSRPNTSIPAFCWSRKKTSLRPC